MFATFFAICILLSIFALCLAFLRFVKKKLHCFQPIRIENFFMCIITKKNTKYAMKWNKLTPASFPFLFQLLVLVLISQV